MTNGKKIQKHLLFYSNLCEHSNEIYQQILKYNLKNKFYFVDISLKKFKIPTNITSVPTVLLDDKTTILKDNKLQEFIKSLNKENEIEVQPYYSNGSLLSDNFSLLDEEDNRTSMINKGFEYIDDNNKLLLMNEMNNSNNGIKNKVENKGLMDEINSLQENRNKDIQNILNRKPPPVK
mgnify:CR=1 FL=1|tara:strand:+ start:10094 stop:10627 length:534 start_codon:yes stop_codon:yes gene_type:complete